MPLVTTMPSKSITEEFLRARAKVFWSKVDVRSLNECWPWTAAKFRERWGEGYGVFWHKRAHRVAFLLAYGHWPEPQCLHTCDNRLCCNPGHLFEGTNDDNMADGVRKKRFAMGVSHPRGMFVTPELASVVLEKYSSGCISQTNLAKELGLSQSTVSLIVRGQWRTDVHRDVIRSRRRSRSGVR